MEDELFFLRLDWGDYANDDERLKAVFHINQFLSREMSVGRVPQNKKELKNDINNMSTPLSIAFVKMAEKGYIDEITASENANLFLEWKIGVNYKANTLLQYEGLLYRVLQSHTSQADWTPDKTPSLYKALSVNETGIMEWSQPISNADAYSTGDEVMYNGVHYRSLIDNNVWSPDEYPQGWENVEV